jgi:ribosome-associated protein
LAGIWLNSKLNDWDLFIVLKKKLSENKIIGIAKDCANVLVNKKALDVLLMDLKEINSYLDYFIIATGNSHIHCTALAKEIQKFFNEINYTGIARPRLDTGWIALDYNDIIVHIFTRELRDYYQLEKLWGDAAFIAYL